MIKKICPNCQSENTNNTKFCGQCGTYLATQDDTQNNHVCNPSDHTIRRRCLYDYQGNDVRLRIPSTVSRIEEGAFADYRELESVIIPDSVTHIGKEAFEGCRSLHTIVIPAGIQLIGRDAFDGCDALTSIYYEGTLEQWFQLSGREYLLLSEDDFAILNDFDEIYCDDKVHFKSLQGDIQTDKRILYIQGKKLEGEITLPRSIKAVCEYAFCNLNDITAINIPSSVKTIGDHAFAKCYGLRSITIPASVTYIGDQAFMRCINLNDIRYTGTRAQWSAIDFYHDMDDIVDDPIRDRVVHCIDGDIMPKR